ncbi:MAG: DUF547 domain-containing protein [Acidobacteria bacterium]|nr:DUF547 domain-containing protein [Acidobacteriota bacterium]
MASGPGFVKRKVGLWAVVAAWLSLLGVSPARGQAPPEDSFDDSAYARVLETFVTPEGQVRYAALKQDPAALNAFLERLAATSPESRPELFPTPAARMAYWINAYNAFVLDAVVEAYPIESVVSLRTLFGALFFKRARFVAGGKKYSLDDIEHGILRRGFADPRLHFALNCASTSCPKLAPQPYRAETLEAQLEQAARRFISREENVWMRGDVLFLSKIFAWYREDFLKAAPGGAGGTAGLVAYVLRYLPEETAERVRQEKPRVEFYDYDWRLNDAARAD